MLSIVKNQGSIKPNSNKAVAFSNRDYIEDNRTVILSNQTNRTRQYMQSRLVHQSQHSKRPAIQADGGDTSTFITGTNTLTTRTKKTGRFTAHTEQRLPNIRASGRN